MRIADRFGRPDVDAFLDSITAEQYAEWCAFDAVEPHGWRATQIAVQRLSYHVRQAAAPKARMKESDFALRLVSVSDHAALTNARHEAMAIQGQAREDALLAAQRKE